MFRMMTTSSMKDLSECKFKHFLGRDGVYRCINNLPINQLLAMRGWARMQREYRYGGGFSGFPSIVRGQELGFCFVVAKRHEQIKGEQMYNGIILRSLR